MVGQQWQDTAKSNLGACEYLGKFLEIFREGSIRLAFSHFSRWDLRTTRYICRVTLKSGHISDNFNYIFIFIFELRLIRWMKTIRPSYFHLKTGPFAIIRAGHAERFRALSERMMGDRICRQALNIFF